jgi:beta-galactosidase
MRERVLALDTSRPITAGINGLGKPEDWPKLDPLFASLDIAGYNYEDARHAADHARLPDRVIALAESYQSNTFGCWAVVHNQPYVIADFVWSALDYLGEAGIGKVFPPGEKPVAHWEADFYPWHGAACGDLDITGWRKPISHYRSIVWDRGEMLYAAVIAPSSNGEPWSLSKWSMPPALPGWSWPGQEGKPLQLEVYSRYDAVRVWLNKQLIGEKPTTREHQFKATFEVNFEPGTVRIAGVHEGREVESISLTTANEASRLRLTPDRDRIRADGQDLSFVAVEVTDRRGRLQTAADQSIRYELTGPGEIAGIGSGDLTSTESYQANPRRTHQGRALVIVRSTTKPGRITLRAESRGLKGARVVVRTE